MKSSFRLQNKFSAKSQTTQDVWSKFQMQIVRTTHTRDREKPRMNDAITAARQLFSTSGRLSEKNHWKFSDFSVLECCSNQPKSLPVIANSGNVVQLEASLSLLQPGVRSLESEMPRRFWIRRLMSERLWC